MAETDNQDVTQRLEALLGTCGVSFDHLAESLPELFYIFDGDGRLLYWNRRVGTFTGRDDETIAAMHPVDFFGGNDRERVQGAIETAFAEGVSRVEADLVAGDGTEHPHLFVAKALATDASPLVAGFGIDISERRAAEDALKASETQYRALVEQGLAGVYVIRGEVFTYVNDRLAEILGYPREDIVGRLGPRELVSPEDYAFVIERMRSRLRGERDSDQYVARGLRSDGSRIWLELYATRLVLDEEPLITGIALDITERKQAEDRLRENQRFLETLVANLPGAVYRCENDPDWPLHFISGGCEELTGHTPEELTRPGSPTLGELIHPDDREDVWRAVQEAVSQGMPFRIQYRLWHREAGYRWVWEQGQALDWDAAGRMLEGFITDITAEKQARDEAARLGEQLTNTLETIPDAFCTLDAQWRFAYVNREAERLFGAKREALIGAVVWDVFPEALGTAVEHHLRRAWETARTTAFEDYDRNGQRWFAFQVYPGEDELAVYVRDITERKRDQAQLEFLALYDPLTRLPNRSLLHDRVSTVLANMGRSGHNGALLLFDVDDFKAINETYGHPTGDALLQELAERLTQTLRRSDSVARLGGDEFAVLLDDLAGDAAAAERQAARVCDKVMAALTQPYRLTDCVYYATVSLGLTLLASGDDVDAVLKRADLAMYRAKDAGRNSRRFFDPAMETAVSSRVRLETRLREAISNDRIELYYQPQVDAEGRMTGAEGLLRWHDPERGWIPPGEFIPIAEQTGLILDLGQKVFEMGCQRLARWAGDPDLAELTLALNVSAHQFHHSAFVDHVLEAVRAARAPAERLRLELTETVVLDSIDETNRKMAELKPHGVRFALDDFGTGYSSLAYLKNLPLDRLKIDRTFVRDMADDTNDTALVRAVIAIARSLDLGVVAEGVETPEARDLLEAAGCVEHQGFLFGAAMPAEAFEAMARASLR